MSDEPRKTEPKDGFDAFVDEEGENPRRLFERAVPEVIKRIVERAVTRSITTLNEAPENIRDLLDDVKVPKEAANYIYDQVDDTKKGVYRVVAKEIRDVLEHMNFADEIADVLTKLQFEVNTTIRFVPNDQADEPDEEEADGDGPPRERRRPSVIPTPKVVSKVVMKARDRLRPKTNPPPKPTDE
jgi:hypothetical protein